MILLDHRTYNGISFHPYETLFVKSSWHVSDAYTKLYVKWFSEHQDGGPGTAGRLNLTMRQYAISAEALGPNKLESLGYGMAERVNEWRNTSGFKGR